MQALSEYLPRPPPWVSSRAMATRLLLPLAVFGVGFGLGYGLTFFLVDEPDATATQASVAATTEPGVQVDAPSALASDTALPLGRGAAGDGELPTEASEDGDEERVKATPDPAPADDQGDAEAGSPDSPPAPPEAAAPPWWDACRGKRCLVDFGGLTGGLSVRRGSVEHGAVVDWDKDFAGAKRIEVLPTDAALRVQVVAIALDVQGRPAAAQIEWRRGGDTLAGVIALSVGDKQVTMRP